MGLLVSDMDDSVRATAYGAAMSEIPFAALKLVFALIFALVAAVQLMAIF
jgi:uncharacterized protein (DUF2062 family)